LVQSERVRLLKKGNAKPGPIIYWMSRDQRLNDNWALLYAMELAKQKNTFVIIVFCLVENFLNATEIQYQFMLDGLKQLANTARNYNIPFILLQGKPEEEIPKYIKQSDASCLVFDFDPLTIKRDWKNKIAKLIDIPFYEVDAHNIVPVWKASPKEEFAAYTFRPKIQKLLPDYLTEYPEIKKQEIPEHFGESISTFPSLPSGTLNTIRNIKFAPGEEAAHKCLFDWINKKLPDYAQKRNDPNQNCQSNLSPYLHFGMFSSQRIALEVNKFAIGNIDINLTDSVNAFLEELIVRKELSDNYCFYNDKYCQFDGLHNWAKTTLNLHRKDEREYIYSLEEFENAETHDILWNAAQNEMSHTGKMHGYMRMYWAKKILEWTESPEEALEYTIYLNDKYELDGRDPNGYTGIAWSIGGVHDRAWNERPVFGKIRYMNYNGCKRKFDINQYISRNSPR
jgi:deoxyribodipyrimidine photo-lyase